MASVEPSVKVEPGLKGLAGDEPIKSSEASPSHTTGLAALWPADEPAVSPKSEASSEDDRSRIVSFKLRKTAATAVKHVPQIHLDEPSATEEAKQVFEEIECCEYQSGGIGEPEQEEIMTCDCRPQVSESSGINKACGPDSDCINRVTSIECVDGECSCGDACANQRFQRRQYVHVDVFPAGAKGYGLRSLDAISRSDVFVYEYIGEVINERRFRQRQIEYQEQGERHFYFMMLQRGEYIDATKRGGLGRFINHSCEPNCYVDKWVVGNKLRMGIFTKRPIVEGEELTFDYNVDRYGGDATPCYCGEPTCLGYIGGKTQTEAANKLPRAVVEALGIDDGDGTADDWIGDGSVARKAQRKKRRAEDDEDYVADVAPRGITEKDVPKIMHTLLQTTERWILRAVLQRMHSDADDQIQARFISLHGYQALGSKLDKWKADEEITVLILEILHKWPRVTKNKISSSKIETYVQQVAKETASLRVRVLANDLIELWGQLQMAYRIPRRARPIKASVDATASDDARSSEAPQDTSTTGQNSPSENTPRRGRESGLMRREPSWRTTRPDGPQRPRPPRPVNGPPTPAPPTPDVKPTPAITGENLQAIIDAAKKQQEEQAEHARLAEVAKAEAQAAEEKRIIDARRKERAERHAEERRKQRAKAKGEARTHKTDSSAPDPSSDAKDERILLSHLAAVVPNAIGKYADRVGGKEAVKKRAKEICKILVAKEMKRNPRDLSEFSDSKKLKIKGFARDFMDKVLKHSSKNGTSGANGSTTPDGSPPAHLVRSRAASKQVSDNGHVESPGQLQGQLTERPDPTTNSPDADAAPVLVETSLGEIDPIALLQQIAASNKRAAEQQQLDRDSPEKRGRLD
ncbi:histone methyltransferase set2 [Savitreella phatthalungensis]